MLVLVLDSDFFKKRERNEENEVREFYKRFKATLIIGSKITTRCVDLFSIIPAFYPKLQWSIFDVMELACKSGSLKRGDCLVMDNASIHDAIDTSDLITELFNIHGTLTKLSPNIYILGVSIQYLPAYSPELNPCGLVFAVVKNSLIVLELNAFSNL
jgi:hypothetical protein